LGTLPGQRRRGRPRMSWLDNITAWTQSILDKNLAIADISRDAMA